MNAGLVGAAALVLGFGLMAVPARAETAASHGAPAASQSDLQGCRYKGTATAILDGGQAPVLCDPYGRPMVTAVPSAVQIQDVPPVQTAAYSSGNDVGGLRSVTVASVPGGQMSITGFMVRSVSGTAPLPGVTVYLFGSNPTGSVFTDRSTFTLAAADVAKIVVPPFILTLVAPTGTATGFAQQTFTPPRSPNAAAGSQLLYYALVANSSFTPASSTDLQVTIDALH